MAKSSTATAADTVTDDPVLLFDAKCGVCNRLAHKVRNRANGPVELLALSDPEAQALLDDHYPTGWDHDFYLINGNVARKGMRALPKIASIVGMRDFSSLATEYGRYLARSEECGEDQEKTAAAAAEGPTRRTFTKVLGGAAGSALIPLSGVVGAESNGTSGVRDTIPDDLSVHVARVRPSGDGFDVDIETDQSLIRRDVWNDGPTADTGGSVEMTEVNQQRLVDTATHSMEQVDLEIRDSDPSATEERALQQSGADDSSVGSMTRYGFQMDRDRHTLSLNTGYGPVVADGESTVAGSLSGEITHDLAAPLVDFITLETKDEASLETHVEAYIWGLKAYGQHYDSQGDEKLADTYATLARELDEVKEDFVSSVDEDTVPLENTLGISSLPSWTYYVESPEASSGSHQDVTTQGTNCSCSCCPAGCCSGCDCGCSACIGVPPVSCGCDCCVVGCGAGCGCGCCYCP